MSIPHPDLPGIAALHPEDCGRAQAIANRLAQGAHLISYRTEGVVRGYLLWTAGAGGTPLVERVYVAPGWRRRGIEIRLRRRLLAQCAETRPG